MNAVSEGSRHGPVDELPTISIMAKNGSWTAGGIPTVVRKMRLDYFFPVAS